MDKKHFSDFVISLAYHFGQDKFVQPGEATSLRLKSWFEQVVHLPPEPLVWMGSEIKKRYDFFPRNLSKCMLELWEEWLKSNPQKKVGAGKCPYCTDGWILAHDQENTNRFAVKCGHCSPGQSKDRFWRATHAQINNRGWSVCRPFSGKEIFSE